MVKLSPMTMQDSRSKLVRPGNWKTLESKSIMRAGLLSLREDRCELPDGRVHPRYFTLEFPDWVNVVPITQEGRMVLVDQYRHSAGEAHLEIPGGSVEPGEEPMRAALRELMEETGFVPENLVLAGRHRPNPAMQNNSMWTYVAFGCRRQGEPTPDPFEDLRVHQLAVPEVYDRLRAGEISHSIVVASLFYAMPMLGIR